LKSIPEREWACIAAPQFTRDEAFRYALDRLADPTATGHELTRARIGLGPYNDTFQTLKLRRQLADARHRADQRDGLRPNGHPRTAPGTGYSRRGGPNHAA